jgi:menaquinol-cytochrome c reductase iron-sulfur subunit
MDEQHKKKQINRRKFLGTTGCTIPFAPDNEKKSKPELTFLCPCHLGEYNEKGINIGGPPPRPLDIFKPIIQNGKVYINVFSPIKRELG